MDTEITLAEQQRRAIAARFAAMPDAVDAFEALQRLSHSFPDRISILLDLLSVAINCCEYATVRTTARRLLELAPESVTVVDRAAEALTTLGQADEARSAWLQLGESGHDATAWTALAGAALRSNRLDEAAEWIDKALDGLRDNPMSALIAAQVARHAGRDQDTERYLAECSAAGVAPLVRFRALYETGEWHDRRDDPVAAVAAWRQAKQCVEEAFPEQVALCRRMREKRLARNQETLAGLAASPCRRWRKLPPAAGLPAFAVLAGHPRSGTTLLEQLLAAHPQVLDLEEKDALNAAFRANLLRGSQDFPSLPRMIAASPVQLAAVRGDYLRRIAMLYGRLPGGKLLLDKNPNLTDALPLLMPVLPGVRLLVARREPRDVLLSCFRLAVTPEHGNIGWLREADAVEDYRSMMAVWERLRDLLDDGERWLEVSYEALCSQPTETAQAVTRFLGLDWHFAQDRYRETRAHVHIASPSHAEVRNPVHRNALGRWQRYADLLPALFAF